MGRPVAYPRYCTDAQLVSLLLAAGAEEQARLAKGAVTPRLRGLAHAVMTLPTCALGIALARAGGLLGVPEGSALAVSPDYMQAFGADTDGTFPAKALP